MQNRVSLTIYGKSAQSGIMATADLPFMDGFGDSANFSRPSRARNAGEANPGETPPCGGFSDDRL